MLSDKLEIIKHRINTLREVRKLCSNYGMEMDIRSKNGRLILNHEFNSPGTLLADMIKIYKIKKMQGTLIFNMKEDGLENKVLELTDNYRIKKFFFLDLSIPTTIKLCTRNHIKNIAVRVSEYETVESALKFKGLANWIWLDSFSGEPLCGSYIKELKPYFKICLASPELEGYPPDRIIHFKRLASLADAVCTKHEELWVAA